MSNRFGLDDIEGGQTVGLTPPPGLSAPHAATRRPAAQDQAATPTPAPKPAQKATSRRPKATKPTRPTPKPATNTTQPKEVGDSDQQQDHGRAKTTPSNNAATRATNITVPAELFDRIAEAREQQQLSTGELIAAAIEAQIADLSNLIAAANTTRTTSMFSTRATRLPRRGAEPEKPITYRMTAQDLAIIDDLVEQYGARSRGQLITIALRAHLAQNA